MRWAAVLLIAGCGADVQVAPLPPADAGLEADAPAPTIGHIAFPPDPGCDCPEGTICTYYRCDAGICEKVFRNGQLCGSTPCEICLKGVCSDTGPNCP